MAAIWHQAPQRERRGQDPTSPSPPPWVEINQEMAGTAKSARRKLTKFELIEWWRMTQSKLQGIQLMDAFIKIFADAAAQNNPLHTHGDGGSAREAKNRGGDKACWAWDWHHPEVVA